MNKGLTFLLPVVCLSFVMATAACGGPENKGGADAGNGSMYILVENTSISLPIKPLRPDRVELIYFHTKNPCHCMAVVGDNIKYAVDTYFKDKVDAGRVKLTMIVSDDPANLELMKKYDAMVFSLFIREVHGDSERISPVGEIWEMTGDSNRDRLVDFIRVKLSSVLEGKGH